MINYQLLTLTFLSVFIITFIKETKKKMLYEKSRFLDKETGFYSLLLNYSIIHI